MCFDPKAAGVSLRAQFEGCGLPASGGTVGNTNLGDKASKRFWFPTVPRATTKGRKGEGNAPTAAEAAAE